MPGQPRDGQPPPGSASASTGGRQGARRTRCAVLPRPKTGSLSGATLPPDGGSLRRIATRPIGDARRIRALPRRAATGVRKLIYTQQVKYNLSSLPCARGRVDVRVLAEL